MGHYAVWHTDDNGESHDLVGVREIKSAAPQAVDSGCSSCEAIGNPEHADRLHNEIADLNLTISRLHRELKAARSCIAPTTRALDFSADETEKRTFEMLDIILGKQLGVATLTPCARCRNFTEKLDNPKCKVCTVEPSEWDPR